MALPGIRGVLLGGSRASGFADADSDTDLYTLRRGPLPDRDARAAALAPLADGGRVVEETAWGVEDHLRITGRLVEIIHLDLATLPVDEAYGPGLAPNGYTTAFLNTLSGGLVVADPLGELAALRARLAVYPEATRARILAQAAEELPGYLGQLKKAQSRGDWTSAVNRRSALQAAWFDALFALNRRYHPGEKRLMTHLASCSILPDAAAARWASVSLMGADDPALIEAMRSLVEELLAAALADLGTLGA
jgi:hypothetical protein